MVVLLLAGCGHAGAPTSGAAASATGTPATAAAHLSWQRASSPGNTLAPLAYAPAPSDGRVTYACGNTSPNAAHEVSIWSTRTRGASWSHGMPLPYTGDISNCTLTVDANDAQRLIATLDTAKMGASPGAANIVAFLSQDGGATWQALPRIGPHGVMSLASFGGAIYASGFGLSVSGAETRDVWQSRDGGRSWRALGAAHLAPNPEIWVNPQTGELLGTDDYDLIPTLWRSVDAGATWTHISVPTVSGAGSQQAFVVAPNGAGWRICATAQTAPGPQEKNTLACSDTLGKLWTQLSALNPTQNSPKGFTFIAPSEVFAITDDGALIATYDDIASGTRFAALLPGASAWLPLGSPRSATGTPTDGSSGLAGPPVYTTGPGGGMLWVTSGVSAHPFSTTVYP